MQFSEHPIFSIPSFIIIISSANSYLLISLYSPKETSKNFYCSYLYTGFPTSPGVIYLFHILAKETSTSRKRARSSMLGKSQIYSIVSMEQ